MNKYTFFTSLIIALLALWIWDNHWSNNGYKAYVDDNDDLWAYWFRKLPELSEHDHLLLGSSRVHFDIDIYEWEKQTEIRPINLASVGSSPAPMLKYIAEESQFSGLVFVGVAPDLCFDMPGQFGWNQLQERLDHARDQTYAQRFNQHVYQVFDHHLTYLSEHLQLEGLIENIPLPQRDSVRPELFWPDMSVNDENRNLQMVPKMETDTAMQNQYKRIWSSFGWRPPDTTNRDSILSMYANWVETIVSRGGKVVFLRAPSTGTYRIYENESYPRSKYWDQLLAITNAPGIHFEDYDALNQFDCPEWSHLQAKDALVFTRELVNILKQHELIKTE